MSESAIQRLLGLDPFPQPPLIRLRYPVVLMHGFGMIGALRRNGHLHDQMLGVIRSYEARSRNRTD